MMKKLIVCILCFSLVFVMAACGSNNTSSDPPPAAPPTDSGPATAPPASVDPIEINISTVQTEMQILGKGANELKRRLEASSIADRVIVNVYPGGSLYSPVEEIDAIRNNDLQLGFVNGTNLEPISNEMGLFKLPYLFDSVEQAYRVLDSGIANDVFASIENFRVLASIGQGHAVIGNSVRPLVTPEDMRGLKIRAPGAIESAIIESMGAMVVVIASDEAYTALQQNVVDGLGTPSLVYEQRRYYEVTDYLTDAGMMWWPISFAIASAKFWDELPDDLRSELQVIMDGLYAEMRMEAIEGLQNTLDVSAAEGVQIHVLSPDEVEVWRAATSSVYAMYEGDIGAELIKKTQDRVKELG